MAQPRRRGRSAPDATPGIQRVWRHRGAMAWLLSPISLLYGALAGLRRLLYVRGVLRVERLPVPVVVVGNVVAGGAGKTPRDPGRRAGAAAAWMAPGRGVPRVRARHLRLPRGAGGQQRRRVRRRAPADRAVHRRAGVRRATARAGGPRPAGAASADRRGRLRRRSAALGAGPGCGAVRIQRGRHRQRMAAAGRPAARALAAARGCRAARRSRP